jgi:DNA-binding CsgD family transcriptional regulator
MSDRNVSDLLPVGGLLAPARTVGRLAELRQLRHLLDGVSQGRGECVVIEGAAGMGKTSMLTEVLAEAARRGAAVSHVSAPPAPTGGHAVVVAHDGLETADPGTLDALSRWGQLAGQVPALVVATAALPPSGVSGQDRPDPFARAAVVIRLGPLPDADVVELAEAALRCPVGPRLVEHLQAAGGVPGLVLELLRLLVEAGAVHRTEDGRAETNGSRLPDAFRDTVLRRLTPLGPPATRLLSIASVLAPRFSFDQLAAVSSEPAAELFAALDLAVRAGILQAADGGLEFVAPVVAEVLYQAQSPAIVRSIHSVAARTLVDAGAQAVLVARHLEAAADGAPASRHEAVAWLRRAAAELGAEDPELAVTLLERALELAGIDAAIALRIEHATALSWAGRPGEAAGRLRDLMQRPLAPPDEFAARLALGTVMTALGETARAAQELRRAAEVTELPEAMQAPLLADTAYAHAVAGDPGGAETRATLALEHAARHDDTATAALALLAMGIAAWSRGYLAEAVELGRDARLLARRCDAPDLLRRVDVWHAVQLVGVDRLGEAEQLLRDILEGSPVRWTAELQLAAETLAWIHLLEGDWEDAVARYGWARDRAAAAGARNAARAAAEGVAWMETRRDHLALARDLVRTPQGERRQPAAAATLRWASLFSRSLQAAVRGKPGEARRVLDEAWDSARAAGAGLLMLVLGPDLVHLHRRAGDGARAREIAEALQPLAERAGQAWTRAAAARARGLAGDDPDAMLLAVSLVRPTPRVVALAATLLDAAEVLAAAGRSRDAVDAATEALAIFERIGAHRDASRAARVIRHQGRRPARRAPAAQRPGEARLSPTELHVAELACGGLSNPEIAAEMSISRRTVETHLAHVYQKLGISSRVALVRALHSRA